MRRAIVNEQLRRDVIARVSNYLFLTERHKPQPLPGVKLAPTHHHLLITLAFSFRLSWEYIISTCSETHPKAFCVYLLALSSTLPSSFNNDTRYHIRLDGTHSRTFIYSASDKWCAHRQVIRATVLMGESVT